MTERESSRIFELKKKKCAEAGYRCEICSVYINAYTCQLAHIIPQTKVNIKIYGKEVIHSEDNMKVVCDLTCNAKAQIKRGCNNGKENK